MNKEIKFAKWVIKVTATSFGRKKIRLAKIYHPSLSTPDSNILGLHHMESPI